MIAVEKRVQENKKIALSILEPISKIEIWFKFKEEPRR